MIKRTKSIKDVQSSKDIRILPCKENNTNFHGRMAALGLLLDINPHDVDINRKIPTEVPTCTSALHYPATNMLKPYCTEQVMFHGVTNNSHAYRYSPPSSILTFHWALRALHNDIRVMCGFLGLSVPCSSMCIIIHVYSQHTHFIFYISNNTVVTCVFVQLIILLLCWHWPLPFMVVLCTDYTLA